MKKFFQEAYVQMSVQIQTVLMLILIGLDIVFVQTVLNVDDADNVMAAVGLGILSGLIGYWVMLVAFILLLLQTNTFKAFNRAQKTEQNNWFAQLLNWVATIWGAFNLFVPVINSIFLWLLFVQFFNIILYLYFLGANHKIDKSPK